MADMKPRLSTKTPDDEQLNALKTEADNILAVPKQRRFIVAELVVSDLNTKVASGTTTPVVQLTHIELLSEKDGEAVLGKAYTKRTGNKVRPAQLEDTPLDLSGATDLDDDDL